MHINVLTKGVAKMKTIFIVDDNSSNLLVAEEVLSDHYEVITMLSVAIMFDLLNDVIPDLILLDIMMPEVDGFAALRHLKANTEYAEIPVMFLTSKSDAATEARAFEMGVVDFISKPFSGPVLLNRIKKHLAIEDLIRERTEMLRHRTGKLLRLQNSMTSVLATMVESRDKLTGKHIERTAEYIKLLIYAMLKKGIYQEELSEWNISVALSAARLHDLGKIAVTDLILNKPDELSADEFEVIKSHAAEGERIIDDIINESGNEEFLQYAKLCAGSHHERWDGTGYPRGLAGTEIPLHGRIMAIADVYDALVSDRPYKKAFSHERAAEIILENKGKQFDPEIVDIFLEIRGLFEEASS